MMLLCCSQFLQGLDFFIEIDGKVVTQPINANEMANELQGKTTSTGEAFQVSVPTADTGTGDILKLFFPSKEEFREEYPKAKT